MRCASCGAEVSTAFCPYCGSKMPIERIETQSINAETVVVNNYYQSDQAPSKSFYRPGPQNPSGNYAPKGFSTSYTPAPIASAKSKTAALLLCIFLGVFGAHRFYVGRYFLGILYFFTGGLLGVGWIVDIVFLITGKLKDRYGLPVLNS